MKFLFKLVFILLFFISLNAYAKYYYVDPKLYDSSAVRIVYLDNRAPIMFQDKNGQPTGLLNDFWKLWSKNTGIPIKFIKAKNYEDSISMLINDKADLHAGLFISNGREKVFTFSKKLISIDYYLYSAAGVAPPLDLDDTKGFFVGYCKSGYIGESLKIILGKRGVAYDDYEKMFKAALNGEIVVFIANDLYLNYFLQKNHLKNIFQSIKKPVFVKTFHATTTKDKESLLKIVIRAAKKIPPLELKKLKAKWMNYSIDEAKNISLSTLNKKEKKWIIKNNIVTITGDPNWLPFESFDEKGNYKGFMADYLKIIESKTGLTFMKLPTKSWMESLNLAENKKVDVITIDRGNNILFKKFLPTYSTLHNPLVVVMKKGSPFLDNIIQIKDKKIAITKGYGYTNILKNKYLDINFIEVNDVKEGLYGVSTGNFDAFICTLDLANYQLQALSLTNLSIAGKLDLNMDLVYGVNRDKPILLSILNKAIISISENEIMLLKQKWMQKHLTSYIDYTQILKIVSVFIIILIIILYKNRKLNLEIVERKKVEEDLEKAKKIADEANKAKSDFLARMSHEIRTPMNAIIGLNHLALNTDLTPKQYDYLKKVETSAKNLLEIINDILDFSKIEAGRLDINYVEFSLYDVIKGLDDVIRYRAEEKGLTLNINLNRYHNYNYHLIGDPLRLNQILINLLSNAIKFTNKGKVELITNILDFKDNKIIIEFIIKDTGIGLKKEQIDKLFTSFSQADGTISRKFGGTGLGLAISKKLVELMNGKIGVVSEYGKGTTFYFTLPFIIIDHFPRMIEEIKSLHNLVFISIDNFEYHKALKKYFEKIDNHKFYTYNQSQAIEIINKIKNKEIKCDHLIIDINILNEDEEILQLFDSLDENLVAKDVSMVREDLKIKRERFFILNVCSVIIKPTNNYSEKLPFLHVFKNKILNIRKPLESDKDSFENIQISSLDAKILLAEDNEINQQIAIELLNNIGITVDIASNGKIAYEKASKNQYDLILMDIQMPEMDGLQATEKIREAGIKTPIIAMTAHAMTGDKDRSIESGMNDHITKPIIPYQFYQTIVKWLPENKKNINKKDAIPVTKDCKEMLIDKINNINICRGLEIAANNKELYLKLLEKFFNEDKNIIDEVDKLIKKADYQSAKTLIHTIKGVSANLGAEQLNKISSKFEKTLNNENLDKIEIIFNQFKAELNNVFDDIKIILETLSKKDLNDLNAPLDEILKLINDDISEAIDLTLSLKSIFYENELENEYNKLVKEMENFEFNNAELIILEIKKKLNN
jgi:polar amino acid transport system substrate-binding protein